jgi:hypothetical protein
MNGLDVMRQRVPLDTCARCRKTIKPGERVMPAYIVVKSKVRHPETKELVSEMSGEFEFVHGSCADPYLDGKVIITG